MLPVKAEKRDSGIASALHNLYDDVLNEPIPPDLEELLKKL